MYDEESDESESSCMFCVKAESEDSDEWKYKKFVVAFIFFKPVMSKRIPEVEYMCHHCRRSDAEDYLHRYTIDYINKVNPYVFNIPNEYEDGDLDEIFIYLIHT